MYSFDIPTLDSLYCKQRKYWFLAMFGNIHGTSSVTL